MNRHSQLWLSFSALCQHLLYSDVRSPAWYYHFLRERWASLAAPAEAHLLVPASGVAAMKGALGLSIQHEFVSEFESQAAAHRPRTSILLALFTNGLSVGFGVVHWLLALSNRSVPYSTYSVEE